VKNFHLEGVNIPMFRLAVVDDLGFKYHPSQS